MSSELTIPIKSPVDSDKPLLIASHKFLSFCDIA